MMVYLLNSFGAQKAQTQILHSLTGKVSGLVSSLCPPTIHTHFVWYMLFMKEVASRAPKALPKTCHYKE